MGLVARFRSGHDRNAWRFIAIAGSFVCACSVTPLSDASQAPVPTTTPDLAAVAGPSVTPSAMPGVPVLGLFDGDIAAGTYAVSAIAPTEVLMTVPDGWRTVQDLPGFSGVVSGALTDQPQTDDFRAIAFWTVGTVFVDPCARTPRTPPVGATVDDLVRAIGEIPSTTLSEPMPVTLSGYPATRVRLSLDDSLPCHPSGFTLWPGRYAQGPAEQDDLSLLVLAGTRLHDPGDWLPGVSDDGLAELLEIIDSIVIRPPTD
jgi:hypothetical protein